MSASHTKSTSGANLRLVPGLGLVDFEGAGLPDALAKKVEGELKIFAAHSRYGLLSAAINVGLDVFAQLLAVEVTEVVAPKGRHDPSRRAVGTAASPRRCPSADGWSPSTSLGCVPQTAAGRSVSRPPQHVGSRELLDRHTLISMLAGVSTRTYSTVLEPAGPEVKRRRHRPRSRRSRVALSKPPGPASPSSPSGCSPTGTGWWSTPRVRPVDEALIGALCMDEKGNTMPLSVLHGTTENKAACK